MAISTHKTFEDLPKRCEETCSQKRVLSLTEYFLCMHCIIYSAIPSDTMFDLLVFFFLPGRNSDPAL